MRVKSFPTIDEAERARAELDAAKGLPATHALGEYTVAQPGNAFARIRARGVRTNHVVDVVANEAGTRFAVQADVVGSEEIDLDAWRGSGRGTRPSRR